MDVVEVDGTNLLPETSCDKKKLLFFAMLMIAETEVAVKPLLRGAGS